MKNTTILLIRHGETAWNAVRRLQGHIDIPLNEEGLRQADALAQALANEPLNAVIASDLQRAMTLGVGAGQMSRIDSARIASIKAQNAGLELAGSAVASDAFFPFRDGLDVVVDAGATCVIHPGGSMRDDEVIAAADERGIAMVLTGTRHFRH